MKGAPHDALTIYWNRGLAAGASLHDLPDAAVTLAYSDFLKRFDRFEPGLARTRSAMTEIGPKIARDALANLPEATSYGDEPALKDV